MLRDSHRGKGKISATTLNYSGFLAGHSAQAKSTTKTTKVLTGKCVSDWEIQMVISSVLSVSSVVMDAARRAVEN
jgi:hypothetical protein